jgi:hypothetical protein
MHNVSIDFGINDGAAQVVGTTHIVVDRVTLGLGALHTVRSSALLGKVDNRIGFVVLDELDQEIVFFGHINVEELDFLATDFFPSFDAILSSYHK